MKYRSHVELSIPTDTYMKNRNRNTDNFVNCTAFFNTFTPVEFITHCSDWKKFDLTENMHRVKKGGNFLNFIGQLNKLRPKKNNIVIFINSIKQVGNDDFCQECANIKESYPNSELLMGFRILTDKDDSFQKDLIFAIANSLQMNYPKLTCVFITNCGDILKKIENVVKKDVAIAKIFTLIERDPPITLDLDQQNKHTKTEESKYFNIRENRGEITVSIEELRRLIKQFAGKGQAVLGKEHPKYIEKGKAGYKERIDFGLCIGLWADMEGNKLKGKFETTKGILTYAKNGLVHLIPSNPNALIDESS